MTLGPNRDGTKEGTVSEDSVSGGVIRVSGCGKAWDTLSQGCKEGVAEEVRCCFEVQVWTMGAEAHASLALIGEKIRFIT